MIRYLERLRRYRDLGGDGEEGFSILELMMALTVLAIGIVAVLGTLVVAAKTAGVQRYRLNAVQIANEQMELIRSRQYEYIGIDETFKDHPDLPQISTSTDTATVTDSAMAVNPFPPPIVRQGVTYNVAVNIAWVSYSETAVTPQPPVYERAYKHARVDVRWTDQVGPHLISVESDIYPGNQGPQREFTGDEATAPPLAPSNLFVQTALGYTDTAIVDITWVDNSDNESSFELWVASAPSLPGSSCNESSGIYIRIQYDQPPDSTYFQFSGLPYDMFHCFRIAAKNSQGRSNFAYSNVYQTGPAPAGAPCSLSNTVVLSPVDPNAPPNRVKLKNNGNNESDIGFKVVVTGACNLSTARVEIPKHPSGVNIEPLTGSTGSELFTVVPPDYAKFSTGQKAVTFRIQGTDGSDVIATQQVCWYKSNVSTCQ